LARLALTRLALTALALLPLLAALARTIHVISHGKVSDYVIVGVPPNRTFALAIGSCFCAPNFLLNVNFCCMYWAHPRARIV
jgi:hypothetical protein